MRGVDVKECLAGGLLLLLGVGVSVQASQYEIGSLRHMGPGYFPLALGIILAGSGVVTLLVGLRSVAVLEAERKPPEWRGWACVCGSVAAFGVLGVYGGLLPATFATVFIAAMGDRKNRVWEALLLAAAMTLVCLVVFWWLLRVQLPLFQWG